MGSNHDTHFSLATIGFTWDCMDYVRKSRNWTYFKNEFLSYIILKFKAVIISNSLLKIVAKKVVHFVTIVIIIIQLMLWSILKLEWNVNRCPDENKCQQSALFNMWILICDGYSNRRFSSRGGSSSLTRGSLMWEKSVSNGQRLSISAQQWLLWRVRSSTRKTTKQYYSSILL